MRAGEMRERMTPLQEVRAPDGAGGFAVSWAPLTPFWAAVEGQGGRETLNANQVQAQARYLIRTRYRTDLNRSMRLQWKTVLLNIITITDPRSLHERLEIVAEEVPNGQV